MARKDSAPEQIPPVPVLGLQDAMLAMEGDETELDKVLELLLDPKNIQHNTELSKNEITAFSVLATMAKRHNLPVLSDFLAENLVLRVSKGRAGRKEWVKIVARHLNQENAEQMAEKRGFFGRRR